MKLHHCLLGISLAALACSQAHAQTVTNITPDSGGSFDTGTIATPSGNVILITGGELSGDNLFHSFSQFDLASNSFAVWAADAVRGDSIANVISRVTGGSPSHIDGSLQTVNMPNADFYFINPAGVIFGGDASVSVPNSAYFSTAHEVRFGSGVAFSTVTPDGSTFSSAPPEAFGFLGGQGAIEITALTRFDDSDVGTASEYALVAGDITLGAQTFSNDMAAKAIAIGSAATEVAIAGPAVLVGDGTISLDSNGLISGAGISVTASTIDLDGGRMTSFGTGLIELLAGDIVLNNASELSTDSNQVPGTGIFIESDTLRVENGSFIQTSSPESSTHDAGPITIVVDDLYMFNSTIRSRTSGEGAAGAVSITARNASLVGADDENRSEVESIASLGGRVSSNVTFNVSETLDLVFSIVSATTFGSEDAGVVSINAGTLLLEASRFGSSTILGSGNSGRIEVVADDIIATNGNIGTDTFGSGNAGEIEVTADNLTLRDGSSILSTANRESTGDAGSVLLNIADTTIVEQSVISAGTSASGQAGSVEINTQNLLFESGRIVSSTLADGDAGDLIVRADVIEMSDFASLNSESRNTYAVVAGNAGTVTVEANSQLVMYDNAEISAFTDSDGDAGAVSVSAALLQLNDSAKITSFTEGAGLAGSTEVTAQIVELSDFSTINSESRAAQSGDAGSVNVTATQSLTISDFATISAATFGAGAAGTVMVTAPLLTMTGGTIGSSTQGSGDAGEVTVQGQDIVISGFSGILSETFLFDPAGAGDAGTVNVSASNVLDLAGNATIGANTSGTGAAGSVLAITPSLILSGESSIQSATSSSGSAGSVEVISPLVVITGDASISTLTTGSGDAGTVDLLAEQLQMHLGGNITSSTAMSGQAGNVHVIAENATLSEGATISSRALFDSSGAAGTVVVRITDTLALSEVAEISAATLGSGDAGFVDIDATALTMNGGAINSFTISTGNAGAVLVTVEELIMTAGRIDSASDSTFADAGDAGDVLIAAGNATLSGNASIDSIGVVGNAGNVGLIVVDTITLQRDENNLMTPRVSASTRGSGDAGSVEVVATGLVIDGGSIESSTSGSGNAGTVIVTAEQLQMSDGQITSFTQNLGDAGSVTVEVQDLQMTGGQIDSSSGGLFVDSGAAGSVTVTSETIALEGFASIASTGIAGDAGDVFVFASDSLALSEFAEISAATDGAGDAGLVVVTTEALTITGGEVSSSSRGSGEAGLVAVNTRTVEMTGGQITSSATDSGDAGDVAIIANSLTLVGPASVNSQTFQGSSGNAGVVSIDALTLNLLQGGEVTTTARGSGDAGAILLSAPDITLDSSTITSTAAGTSVAGAIILSADTILVDNGSAISTNSDNGPAGDITLILPDDGFLQVSGETPSVITTSSGANSGGVISISNPYLILSDGGNILALGEQGGANVQIQSRFFIRSADRPNRLSVDGSLVLDSQIGDQIASTEPVDLPFVDASSILSGQCAGTRSSGRTSRFIRQITGPYTPASASEAPPQEDDPAENERDQIIASIETLAPCS